MKNVNLWRAGLVALAVLGAAGAHAQEATRKPVVYKCVSIQSEDPNESWELRLRTRGPDIRGGTLARTGCRRPYHMTGGTLSKSIFDFSAEKHGGICERLITLDGEKTDIDTYSGTYRAGDGPVQGFTAKLHAC